MTQQDKTSISRRHVVHAASATLAAASLATGQVYGSVGGSGQP
ncbi:hypothetical protein ACVIIV_006981 [Bradyrhizobium sp. USDA 4354]